MARLIDADKLQEEMYHEVEKMYYESFETDTDMQKWDSGCWIRYKIIENIIEKQEIIDAEPVRHGKWIDGKDMMYCSECSETYDKGYKIDYRYCPNCGAKMDFDEVSDNENAD